MDNTKKKVLNTGDRVEILMGRRNWRRNGKGFEFYDEKPELVGKRDNIAAVIIMQGLPTFRLENHEDLFIEEQLKRINNKGSTKKMHNV